MFEVDEATVMRLNLLPAYILNFIQRVWYCNLERNQPNGISRCVVQICSMNQIHLKLSVIYWYVILAISKKTSQIIFLNEFQVQEQ